MAEIPRSAIPDDRNWTFLDAVGSPVANGATPIKAQLPMTEVVRIFELVSYVTTQLDACHAAAKVRPAP